MSESDDIKRENRPSSLKYKKKQTAQSKLVPSSVPNFTINMPAISSEAAAADQESQTIQAHSTPRSTLPNTPTKIHHLKANSPLPSRLKMNLSTDSVDSGLQSGASSRTQSCRTSEEVSASNLIRPTSRPVLTDNDDNSKLSPQSPEHETILGSPKPALIIHCSGDSNSKLKKRYSVNEDVLADLMKAALRLKSDAQPLNHEQLDVTDGPYTSRRKSTGDSYQLNPGKERNRRMSSQAYFHSLVNFQKSPTQRKISGCIICDRKRKNSSISSSSSSSTSTVIIKTTMSRKSLQTRRFSEAMQVMSRSQSNIPYVELYVMKIEDLKKLQEEYSSIHKPRQDLLCIGESREETIREYVTSNLPDFFRYINWTTILCHLVSKRLLSSDDRQKLCGLTTNTEKGNFFYLEVLPTKGDDAYCRFYNCIKDEQEHSGHTELRQKLNRVLCNI